MARRFKEADVELQATKHKINEQEIKMYEIRREKDLMQLSFEELVRENPHLAEGEAANALKGRFEENQREKMEVLEKYIQQVQVQEARLADKDNMISQLQTEYSSLL